MRFCLLVVALISSSLVVADVLTPLSYNVREPSSFRTDKELVTYKYTLVDNVYDGNKSDGYLKDGRGKLTDGQFGLTDLPSSNVAADDSRWVSWRIKNHPEPLSIYFTFQEDIMIQSVTVNSLSQKFIDGTTTNIYSNIGISLLKEDNTTMVNKEIHVPPNQSDIGVHNDMFMLKNCKAGRIALLEFQYPSTEKRLIFGEMQFKGESGWRVVLYCLSNKDNISIEHSSGKIDCQITRTADDRYNCTITKERIKFKDAGRYTCTVYGNNGDCESKQEDVSVLVAGIYANTLDQTASIGSTAMLSCHSASFIGSITFEKRNTATDTFVRVVDSDKRNVSHFENDTVSWATLRFLNVTQTDGGTYRCYYKDQSQEFLSQDMRLSIGDVPVTPPSSKTRSIASGSTTLMGSSFLRRSTQFFSSTPTSDFTTTLAHSSNTSSGGKSGSDGGLGGGVIAGIAFVILLVIMVVVCVIIYIFWRHRRPHSDSAVAGIRYKKDVANDHAYDTPSDMTQYSQSSETGCINGTTNSHNGHGSLMPPQVSFYRFPEQQVNESPDYAEAEEVVYSRSKTLPINGLTDLQIMRNRQASMPPKLAKSQLLNCQTVSDSVVYSEPAIVTDSTRSRQPSNECMTPRNSSRDSGLGHDHDASPNHVYERVPQQSIIEDPSLIHRQVADLAIYASVNEINHHSEVAARQSVIEMDEDLSPEFILSFSESASVSSTSHDGILPYLSVYADPAPLLQSDGPPEMLPEKFSQHRRIGQGQFGDVFQAFAKSILVEHVIDGQLNGLCVKDIPVALKCLRAGATKDMEEAFNKEVKFMAHLRHQHVVRLLGVCSMVQPKFMVIEYMENGDLNQYLQQFELDEQLLEEGKQLMSYDVLVSMAADVASGMEYLTSKFFIHRDLATRNCLVGQNHIVKIADFGMTRSVYEKNYYRLAGRAILPIRWMAPECFYGKFTMMSDIWAYGVTCWEIFTLAREQPYHDLEDKQVIENAVRREGRMLLDRPSCCDDPTFQLVLDCWNEAPELRPSFTDICERLRLLVEERSESSYT